jgi:hypothetical protein
VSIGLLPRAPLALHELGFYLLAVLRLRQLGADALSATFVSDACLEEKKTTVSVTRNHKLFFGFLFATLETG